MDNWSLEILSSFSVPRFQKGRTARRLVKYNNPENQKMYNWINLKESKCPYFFLTTLYLSYVLHWVSQENKYHILTQSSPVCIAHITVSFFPMLITDQRLKIAVVRKRGHLSHCNFQKCGLCPQIFLWEYFVVNETYFIPSCPCKTWEELTKWDSMAEGFLFGFFWLHKH